MTRLATHQLPAARLRAALDLGGLDALPDADLLDRFAGYGEHAAFDSLLRRHGPMVFGVCRRVLANAADAEDAFQATFLVLVRRAGSLRRADRLGPWLYGVAFKVAAKARARAARLATRQTEATDMIPDPTPEPPDWLPVLDAELSALPAKYREPLVLCELQGASRADAAKALGIPEGTLSSRLARGRDLLRKRLLKHGTLLPAGGLAALFSTGGIGRAAIPANLLAKTSELAAVPAGMVPAGAARLTDDVMKSMMLTKLRAGVGAVLATALVAVGIAAALPDEAANQPEKPKASPAAGAKAQSAKPGAKTPAAPDRDALQGLWVLEKAEVGKHDLGARELAGKMQFLVAGNVWWGMLADSPDGVAPTWVALDPAKNPKWIDVSNLSPGGFDVSKGIYELAGDRLRLCIGEGSDAPRPAEFVADDESGVSVMQFVRGKLPPAAGEPALVGSWVEGDSDPGRRPAGSPAQRRVEILDGYLFALTEPDQGKWLGGKYTVDATKNPKWIDVELTGTGDGDKAKHLYGSYEAGADGRLKLVLGTTGRRAVRPLELQPARGVMYFDLGPTKEPITRGERAVREAVPAPRPEPAAQPRDLLLPDRAPVPKLADEDADVRRLMRDGTFAAAEDVLRVRLAQSAGLLAAERRVQLGVCLTERGKRAEPKDARTLWSQAAGNFSLALKELADEKQPDAARAARLRTQVGLRTLQLHQLAGKPNDLLLAATVFLQQHHGTVEELIGLSLVYHALKQKNESGRALQTRDRMLELFEKLKDEPGAFTAKEGEYSRDYWEKSWFADERAKMP